MKNIRQVIIMLTISLICKGIIAQPVIQWQKCIGGSGGDWGRAITQSLNNNSYYATGYSNSSNGDVDTNRGGMDIVVSRLDFSGNILWIKTFGGSLNDYSFSIIPTFDGGVAIGGFTASTDGDVVGAHGGFDVWILKIDSSGNLEWAKTYGGSSDEGDHFVGIVQTPDSGFVFTTNTKSDNFDVSGNHGDYDGWVVKINPQGNMEWQKCYGSSGSDCSHFIFRSQNGNYYLAGHTSGNNDGDINGVYGGDDVWLFKISTTGTLLWSKCFGGTGDELVKGISMHNNKNIYFNGLTNSTDNDVVGLNGGFDMWTGCVDTSGNLVWQHPLGGTLGDYGITLSPDFDSGLLVVGSSASSDGDLNANYGSSDIWLVKIDSSGNIIWQKNYGGTGYEDGQSVYSAPGEGSIVTGFTFSTDGDVIGNHSASCDMWVLRLTCAYPTVAFTPGDSSLCTSAQLGFTNNTDFFNLFQWFVNEVPDTAGMTLYHDFTIPGTDTVTLVSAYGSCFDTLSHYITLRYLPSAFLGNDTLICGACTLLLDAGNPGASYLWSTGDTTQTVIVAPADTFWVVVDDNGCLYSDTIIVDFLTGFVENEQTFIVNYISPGIFMTKLRNLSYKIEIFDISGRLVYQKNVYNEGLINIQSFDKGIYFMKLSYNNNSLVYKLMK